MLDQEIPITGWRATWLARTSPAFQYYTNLTSYALSLSICALGLIGFFSIRRCTQQLKSNPTARAALLKKINARVVKVCRGHWYIANIYLFNTLVIALVDAYIGVVSISDDVAKNGQDYDSGFWMEFVAYCAYVAVIFAATLFVVPLMQVLGATWVLARFMRKRGVSSLAEYIPEARMYSTHIAQVWTMVGFFVMAWWAPMTSHTLTRWIILQGSIGSALAWLDASFAFNFCHKRLTDQDFELGTGGVAEIALMFADTVVVVHSTGKSEKDVLPRYENATINATAVNADDANEKTPLTETAGSGQAAR